MFLSLPFIILFTCCLILYYTVKGNYQKPVLLLASCIFIGYFNIAYLLIAALIAAITFYWGRWIGMQEQENKRRRVFIGGILFLVLFLVAFKYLNFIADIFGVSADDRQARIRDYAARFELTDDLAQPIAAYSHGMKQKLAIISAWLHQPRLILMDEPFVGLDPKAAHLLKGMMRELCDAGGAIFFSTHVLEVAEKLCDKVAIIKGGKLIRSGMMEDVKGDESLESVFLELEEETC